MRSFNSIDIAEPARQVPRTLRPTLSVTRPDDDWISGAISSSTMSKTSPLQENSLPQWVSSSKAGRIRTARKRSRSIPKRPAGIPAPPTWRCSATASVAAAKRISTCSTCGNWSGHSTAADDDPLGEAGRRLAHRINDVFREVRTRVVIPDGSLLIWDNQRMLHARPERHDRTCRLTEFWSTDWRRA